MVWYGSRPNQSHDGYKTEEGFMASAADLMVGLLFIFIIMVAFLAHQRNTEAEAYAEAHDAVKDPRGAVTDVIGNQIRIALGTDAVRIDPSSGVISLPEDVLFDLGRSDLKFGAEGRLLDVANNLSAVLPCFVANQRVGKKCSDNPYGHEIETIFIEGHTDSRPMSRDGGNTKLSLDRAISVSNALVKKTPLDGYRNDQNMALFSYSAYADSRPLKGINPADGRNRRVDLRIVLTYRANDSSTPWGQVGRKIAR